MAAKVILLVEDNRDDEELALLAFEKGQVANEVVVARDGAEALDYLFATGVHLGRDASIQPQMVLLDLKLPKIDGLEVLRRIRGDSRTRRMPVIILTSSREDEDLLRGYDLGANSYVRKPVDFNQFVEAVRHLQLYWLVINEPPPPESLTMDSTLQILMVEDLADDAELLAIALHRSGLTLDWKRVENAAELRTALASQAWDIVLSDFGLPGFGAEAALKIVRAIDPDLPFIVVSGTIGEELAVQIMRAEASDYVLKESLARLGPAVRREVRETQSRRARRAAEAESRLLAAIVRSSDDAIISHNLDGTITSWNPGAERLFGWTAAEAVHRPITFLCPPDRLDEFHLVIESAGTGDPAELTEITCVAKGDGRFDASLRVSSIRNENGQIVGACTIVRDITRTKNAENALRRSEERLRKIVDTDLVGIGFWNPDGEITDANDVFLRLVGHSRDDLRNGRVRWTDLTPPEYRAFDELALEEIARTGRCTPYQKEFLRKDGSRIPILLGAAAIRDGGEEYGVAYFLDSTPLKRAQDDLKQRNAGLRALSEAAAGLLVASDPNQMANDLFQAVSGHLDCDVFLDYSIDGQRLQLGAAKGIDDATREALALDLGQELCGSIATNHRPLIISDVSLGSDGPSAAAQRLGLRTFARHPLLAGNRLLGTLIFGSRTKDRFADHELEIIRTISHYFAVGLGRLRGEAERDEVLQRLQLQIERMPIGYVVYDTELRYTGWNPAAERIFGYSEQEIRGQSLMMLVPPEAQAHVANIRERLQAGDVAAHSVNRNLTKTGALITCEWHNTPLKKSDGSFLGVLSMVIDVTERTRVEAALRLRDRAIQAATQGIMITDPCQADNPLLYVSPGFERITGYLAEEVVGRNCRLLQGPETSPDSIATLRAAIRSAEPCTVELQNYRKDGTPYWNELSLSPVLDGTGQLTHFVGVQTDVTARHRMEGQLRQSQKMEAIGLLAGGVAHEFNNLLTIINGFCEILLDQLPRDDLSRSPLEMIEKAGVRAAALTRNLLSFSRQEVLAPRILNLNDVISESERMFGPVIGEDIHLVTRLAPDLALVQADRNQIEQVLLNLVVNSRDAMPNGGELRIETSNVELGEDFAANHPEVQVGRHVRLTVTDTGCGMSGEVLMHLFEPFFTTKSPGKGTGLGLPTIYGIVKQSQGHLDVESEVGRGTTFKVYFPEVAGVAANAKDSAVLKTPASGSETVLVVEDEDDVRVLIRTTLADYGYTVLEATDGHEALRIATEHVRPIDLLVTDVIMPRMGGREVAERVSELHPWMKVLFVSGYTDDSVVRSGVIQDSVNFMQKPLSPIGLAFKIREILDSHA